MFRNRLILAVLALVAVVPLVGCAGRRCCGRDTYSARPVYAAPAPCPCPTGAAVVPG
jgi:hypothetical protein